MVQVEQDKECIIVLIIQSTAVHFFLTHSELHNNAAQVGSSFLFFFLIFLTALQWKLFVFKTVIATCIYQLTLNFIFNE